MSMENTQGSEPQIVSNSELFNNTLLYLNGSHRHTGYLSPKIPLMSKSDMQEKDHEVPKRSDFELTAEGSESCLSVKMLKSSNNHDLFSNSSGATNFYLNSTSVIDKNEIRNIIENLGETVSKTENNSPNENKNSNESNFPLETYECLDKYVSVTNSSKNVYSNELKNSLEFHSPKRSNGVVDTLDIKLTNPQSEGTVKECFEKNIELQCSEVTDHSQACLNEQSICDPNHEVFMDPSNSKERKLADDYDCSQSLFSSPQSQVVLANGDTPGDLTLQLVTNKFEKNGMDIDSDLTCINETELISCHRSEERISSDDTLELNSEELKGDFVYMIPKENEGNGYMNSLTFTLGVQNKDHIESNCTSLEVNSFKSNLKDPTLPHSVANKEIELRTDEDRVLDFADEKDNVPVETLKSANSSPSLLAQIEEVVDGSKSEAENPRLENGLDKFEYVKNLQQDKTFRSVLSLNKNGDPTFNNCGATRLDFDKLLESDMDVTENRKPNVIFKTKSTRCVNKFMTPWKLDDLSMDEMNVTNKKQKEVSTESFKKKTTTTDALCIDKKVEKVEDTSKTTNEKSNNDFDNEITKTGEVERNDGNSNNCFEDRSDSNILKCEPDHTRSDNCSLQSRSYSVADSGNSSDLNYKSKPSPAHDFPDKNSDIRAVLDNKKCNNVEAETCNITRYKRKDVVTKDVFYETRGKSKRIRISRTTCDFGTCSEDEVIMCTQNTCSQMSFRTDGNSQRVKERRDRPPKCAFVNREVKLTSEKNDILEKGKYLLGKIESRLLKIQKIIEQKDLTAKNVGRAQILLNNLSPVLRKTEECYNYVDVRSMCADFDRKISPKLQYLKNLQEVLIETVETLILRAEENDHESDREEFREETSCGEDNLNEEDINEENKFNNSMNPFKSVTEEASALETLNPPTIFVKSLNNLSKSKPLVNGYNSDSLTDSPSLVMNKQISDCEVSNIKDRGTTAETIDIEDYANVSETNETIPDSLTQTLKELDQDLQFIPGRIIDHEEKVEQISQTVGSSCRFSPHFKVSDSNNGSLNSSEVKECRIITLAKLYQDSVSKSNKNLTNNFKDVKVPGINRIDLVEEQADSGLIKPVHVKGHDVTKVTEAQFSQSGKSSSILTNIPNRNQISAPNNNNILAVQAQFNKVIQKDSITSNPIRFRYYFSKQNTSSDNRGSSEVLPNLMNSAVLSLKENSKIPQPVSTQHSFGAKNFPNNSCEFISQRGDPPLSESLIKTDPMILKLVDNNTMKPGHSISSVPCVDNPTTSSKRWTGTIPQLISKGFLKPGKNVFSVHTPQEITFASLDEHGRMIGKNGIVYQTPVKWCADIPNFGQKLTNKNCYERIYYQGCSLSQIRSAYQGLSDQAASQETPVIAPTRSDPEVIQRSISPERPLLSKRGPIALNLLKMKLLLIGDNEVGPDSYDVDNWDDIDRWE